MAEKFVLMDKSTNKSYVSDSFELIKEKLSEITELDLEVTNKEWEKVQLLTTKDLPFDVSLYELRVTRGGCLCYWTFQHYKRCKLTMKSMKTIATKKFEPQAFNKWKCRECGEEHTKNW